MNGWHVNRDGLMAGSDESLRDEDVVWFKKAEVLGGLFGTILCCLSVLALFSCT